MCEEGRAVANGDVDAMADRARGEAGRIARAREKLKAVLIGIAGEVLKCSEAGGRAEVELAGLGVGGLSEG